MEQEPGSIKALNDAIDAIITDVVAGHNASQKLIIVEIDSYKKCKAMPLVDADANENAAVLKDKMIHNKLAVQWVPAEGTIKYRFDAGGGPDESEAEANRVEDSIDKRKEKFDAALNLFKISKIQADDAELLAFKLDDAMKKAKHDCFCAARKAYDAVAEAAKKSNVNDRENLKHFRMSDCLSGSNKKVGSRHHMDSTEQNLPVAVCPPSVSMQKNNKNGK